MKSLNPNFTNSPLHNNHASRDGPAIKFGRVIGWRQLKNSRGLLECVWEKDGIGVILMSLTLILFGFRSGFSGFWGG